jgi:hypothetical protein
MEFEEVSALPPSACTGESMASADGFLSIEGCAVRWYSRCGRAVHRHFECEAPPLQAAFCSFPLAGPSFQNSVVIVLPLNRIRILASGARYDINLSFSISRVFASSIGLLVQGAGTGAGAEPLLHTVTHPIMRLGRLRFPSSFWLSSLFSAGALDETCGGGASLDEISQREAGQLRLLCVHGSLLCALDEEQQRVCVFDISPLPRPGHGDSDDTMSAGYLSTHTPSLAAERSRDSAQMDVTRAPDTDPSLGLEVRGRGLAGAAATRFAQPGPGDLRRASSGPDDGMQSHSLVANFASAAGENSAAIAIGGTRLRYAAGAANRRRRTDNSAAAAGAAASAVGGGSNRRSKTPRAAAGATKVDTFYNALLGIDRTWSLQQNTNVTASWLRQAAADAPPDRSMESALSGDTDFDSPSFSFSAATPSRRSSGGGAGDLTGGTARSGDGSGLGSSLHSHSGHAGSDGEGGGFVSRYLPAHSAESFSMRHVCSVPLSRSGGAGAGLPTARRADSDDEDTFFDRLASGAAGAAAAALAGDMAGSGSGGRQEVFAASIVPSAWGGERFLDIRCVASGEFSRYALPSFPEPAPDGEGGAGRAPLLHWARGVGSSAEVTLPSGQPATILCFLSGEAALVCGGETVGPVHFSAAAGAGAGAGGHQLRCVRTLRTADAGGAEAGAGDVWDGGAMRRHTDDLFICEFASSEDPNAVSELLSETNAVPFCSVPSCLLFLFDSFCIAISIISFMDYSLFLFSARETKYI